MTRAKVFLVTRMTEHGEKGNWKNPESLSCGSFDFHVICCFLSLHISSDRYQNGKGGSAKWNPRALMTKIYRCCIFIMDYLQGDSRWWVLMTCREERGRTWISSSSQAGPFKDKINIWQTRQGRFQKVISVQRTGKCESLKWSRGFWGFIYMDKCWEVIHQKTLKCVGQIFNINIIHIKKIELYDCLWWIKN